MSHYGLMAEFHDANALVEATKRVRREGYRQMDAYTPFPIEELAEALEFRDRRVAALVLVGGCLGAIAGFGLQYWINVINYPLIIGGKPYFSWPNFIPVTFEMTILFAAFAAVFGMLGLNGLPQPYHPVFNVPNFALASRDRFFLVVEASDPKFDARATRALLSSLTQYEVVDVAN